MTEHNPENDHQDPAEQYKVDEAVQTEEQKPEAEPTSEDSSDSDDADPEPPAPSEPVEVAPDPVPNPDAVRVGGDDYTLTADRGHRKDSNYS